MPLSPEDSSRLYELDRTHWLHPQGDLGAPVGTVPQLIFTGGSGAVLTDVDGREYVDGMASLWNVNVGYGRDELAAAAAAQMKTLAFSSASLAAPRPTTPHTRSRACTGSCAASRTA